MGHHVPLGLELRGNFKFYGDIELWSLELVYLTVKNYQ